MTGPVEHPGIYTFSKPPTLFEALDKIGPLPMPNLLKIAGPERLQSGIRLRCMKVADGSWEATREPMAARKMLVLGIPFDVNDAGTEELVLLPGIGHALAQRIVALRDSTGPFKTWEEVGKVKGVGPRKIETLREYFGRIETTP
jgi:competence protein ComEA